jgi:hypothetical protein
LTGRLTATGTAPAASSAERAVPLLTPLLHLMLMPTGFAPEASRCTMKAGVSPPPASAVAAHAAGADAVIGARVPGAVTT